MNCNLLPPSNALRVFSWDQIPDLTKPARYAVHNEGQAPQEIVVSQKNRRVLEALMRSPVFAASPCRLSDKVLPLRRDHDVEIDCINYQGDVPTKRERFGVYFLKSKVVRLDEHEVVA